MDKVQWGCGRSAMISVENVSQADYGIVPQHGIPVAAPNLAADTVAREFGAFHRYVRCVVEMGSPRLDGWYSQKRWIQVAELIDAFRRAPIGVIHHQTEFPGYVGDGTVVVNQVVE